MYNISKFLPPNIAFRQTCRFVHKKRYDWRDQGIKYANIKYYPRDENFKDSEPEPQKLFRVQRIHTMRGTPYWERAILKELKLDGKRSDVAIVKNIPEENARLWRVKHLIKIDPITFPNGPPKDCNGTMLKENGEFVVTPELVSNSAQFIESESFAKSKTRLLGDTLRRELRKRWLSGW